MRIVQCHVATTWKLDTLKLDTLHAYLMHEISHVFPSVFIKPGLASLWSYEHDGLREYKGIQTDGFKLLSFLKIVIEELGRRSFFMWLPKLYQPRHQHRRVESHYISDPIQAQPFYGPAAPQL